MAHTQVQDRLLGGSFIRNPALYVLLCSIDMRHCRGPFLLSWLGIVAFAADMILLIRLTLQLAHCTLCKPAMVGLQSP